MKYSISVGRPRGVYGDRGISVEGDDLQRMIEEPELAVEFVREIKGEALPLFERVDLHWRRQEVKLVRDFRLALEQDGLTLEEWQSEQVLAYLNPKSAEATK